MTPPAPPTSPRPTRTWVPWLLAMASSSLVVAMAVGILKSVAGAALAEAVLAGGTAFGATMGTCLVAVTAVRELRKIT